MSNKKDIVDQNQNLESDIQKIDKYLYVSNYNIKTNSISIVIFKDVKYK